MGNISACMSGGQASMHVVVHVQVVCPRSSFTNRWVSGRRVDHLKCERRRLSKLSKRLAEMNNERRRLSRQIMLFTYRVGQRESHRERRSASQNCVISFWQLWFCSRRWSFNCPTTGGRLLADMRFNTVAPEWRYSDEDARKSGWMWTVLTDSWTHKDGASDHASSAPPPRTWVAVAQRRLDDPVQRSAGQPTGQILWPEKRNSVTGLPVDGSVT